MQKVLVIVGPTASGKSSLGVKLAKRFNGEIISADSRQVYKDLDIGTGKVTKKEMQGVRHHLLDVVSPKRAYSAGAYQKAAAKAIKDIAKRGKLPIIVGGTGFYIDALLGRISLPDVPPDTAFRSKHNNVAAATLLCMLQEIDPARAKAMDTPSERNNRIRLIRAIEIAKALGKNPKPASSLPYEVLWVGIRPDDATLRRRINTRLSERIRKGMLAEAKRLHRDRLSYKRMEALGLEYRSLARHLQGIITRKEMEQELRSDIWRYAKKQIGYWKRNAAIAWYPPKLARDIERKAEQWLKKKETLSRR
ncbi:MAG TPA: tRNA (adenosine(37)-N6)-dimethylallyltransferase MiaA [Candidatus Paceibacterota bacterium]|nr:tRNA (adenosine(37)-N6)-dimethylallyltransferase MiaA [Candidatus Paceibacterota bacterium]